MSIHVFHFIIFTICFVQQTSNALFFSATEKSQLILAIKFLIHFLPVLSVCSHFRNCLAYASLFVSIIPLHSFQALKRVQLIFSNQKKDWIVNKMMNYFNVISNYHLQKYLKALSFSMKYSNTHITVLHQCPRNHFHQVSLLTVTRLCFCV